MKNAWKTGNENEHTQTSASRQANDGVCHSPPVNQLFRARAKGNRVILFFFCFVSFFSGHFMRLSVDGIGRGVVRRVVGKTLRVFSFFGSNFETIKKQNRTNRSRKYLFYHFAIWSFPVSCLIVRRFLGSVQCF